MITVLVVGVVLLAVAAFVAWLVSASTYKAPVTADETHLVTTPDLWRIRLCRYKAKKGPGKRGSGEPVLLCHGFMSNQYNFSLPAGEAIVDALAEQGYDCWAIDLRGARSSIPPFGRSIEDPTVDDYLLRDIPATIAYIRKATGFAKVHWIGHSMGGMLFFAYNAAFGTGALASGTTLGAPIGFAGVAFRRPTALFFVRRLSWGFFRCLQRLLITFLTTFRPRWDVVPINWANMNPKMDAQSLFSTVEVPPLAVGENLSNAAEKRQWLVKDGSLDVFAEASKTLRTPLFAIFGADDPFVPVHTIEGFFSALPVADKKLLLLSKENGHSADYSHVDLVFAADAKADVFDPIIAWIGAHPVTKQAAAPGESLPAKPDLLALAPSGDARPVPQTGVLPGAALGASPKSKRAPAQKAPAAKKAAASVKKAAAPRSDTGPGWMRTK